MSARLCDGYFIFRLNHLIRDGEIKSCPHQTTFQDVAQAVFTGNPDCLNVEEEEGIKLCKQYEHNNSHLKFISHSVYYSILGGSLLQGN